ncbi:MAG TPA: sporulation protein YabP [Candidatus Gemmiger faecigallinarum]|nr:sporulation protein YabP [Candidatus Gemmiger faecigallinarum]
MQARQNETLPVETPAQTHTLTLENRRTLTATGVTRIVSCDETGAALDTAQGRLTIGGQGIQVGELSVRTGEVRISGKIEFLQYAENRESSGGFFRRLFG